MAHPTLLMVGILVADGVDGAMVGAMRAHLQRGGAQVMLVGVVAGQVTALDGRPLTVDIVLKPHAPPRFEALIVPDGGALAAQLGTHPLALALVRHHYQGGKPLLAVGDGVELLVGAGVPLRGGGTVIVADGSDADGALAELLDQLTRAAAPGTTSR